MAEQDRQLSNLVTEQRARLRNFIRKRVANEADVDELLQEVFYELVRAHRLLLPIDVATAWLFRVARNRITDFFRKKRPETFAEAAVQNEEGDWLALEELLPSQEEGPEAAYLRHALLEAMEAALRELPAEQRGICGARDRGAGLQGAGRGEWLEHEHAAGAKEVCGTRAAGEIAGGARRVFAEMRRVR